MKSILITLAFTLAAPLAFANADLAKAKNCMVCHGMDKKIVGPAFKDVAAKYAKDKTAVKKLAEKIIKGGAGNWGPAAMPPNAVTQAEAETLAKWVLTVK